MLWNLGLSTYFKKLRSAVSEPPAWPKSLGFSDSRHISPIRDGVGLLEFTIAIQNTNARPRFRLKTNQQNLGGSGNANANVGDLQHIEALCLIITLLCATTSQETCTSTQCKMVEALFKNTRWQLHFNKQQWLYLHLYFHEKISSSMKYSSCAYGIELA